MYVVVLGLIAVPAVAGLFHWAMHEYGYGLTALGCAVVLVTLVVIFEGRW